VDPELGSCRVHFAGHPVGAIKLKVNGKQVLEGAHVFHGTDSLVAIISQDGIDILAVFKGDSTRGSVQLLLVNPGKEKQVVSNVEILASGHVGFSGPSGCGGLWNYISGSGGDSLIRTLDLSGSAMVLLSEERLSLPPLQFFYHLCHE